MARHKFPSLPEFPEPDLDISSLIDICFLLLIYFIISTTIVPRERDLRMSLPGKQPIGTPQPQILPMVIRIDAKGAVHTGHGLTERELDTHPESRDLPLLCSQLTLYNEAARSAGNEASIMLRVNEDTRQQRVVDVLNALAATGISAVAFDDLTGF